MKYLLTTILMVTVLTVGSSSGADDGDYKTYEPRTTFDTLFTISFLKNDVTIAFSDDQGTGHRVNFERNDLNIETNRVSIKDQVLFSDAGLTIDGVTRSLDDIHDIHIRYENDTCYITALSRSASSTRLSQLRRGNRIEFERAVIIDEEEFVRGAVFSIIGDVEVYGEVNKDVVSLFGDIYVGPEAVVRGDMVAVTGQIDVAPDATVYGESYTAHKRRRSYRSHLATHYDRFSTQVNMGYNRVDGFSAWWGQKYHDDDISIPTFWGKVGYAFASERWRFDLGIEQDLWRKIDLKIGARYYRDLAADDDWVIGPDENSITSILARKDYKDWWEAEGSQVSLGFAPFKALTITASYNNVKSRWLDAHHNLWALFGGDPFQENFAMVDSATRAAGIETLDGSIDGFVAVNLQLDTRNERHMFERSGWNIQARMEYSHPDLDSDFDYKRYWLSVARYQRLDRHKMLLLRGVTGDSDGEVPMHKLYYLGGLGTLRGYDQKEFVGDMFMMANAELRQSFPRTDLAVSLHYDAGVVDVDNTDPALMPEDEQVYFEELKQSVGVSVYLGSDLRVTAAKRLDRSTDNDPELYVRFSHKF